MSTLNLRLPDSLHRQVQELAARDAITVDQFIAIAVAEKTAALLTVEHLAARARCAAPEAIERILANVPARAPLPGDELPGDEPAADEPPSGARAKRGAPGAKPRRSPRGRG